MSMVDIGGDNNVMVMTATWLVPIGFWSEIRPVLGLNGLISHCINWTWPLALRRTLKCRGLCCLRMGTVLAAQSALILSKCDVPGRLVILRLW